VAGNAAIALRRQNQLIRRVRVTALAAVTFFATFLGGSQKSRGFHLPKKVQLVKGHPNSYLMNPNQQTINFAFYVAPLAHKTGASLANGLGFKRNN
jgi:hypothetical protein